MWVRNFPQQIRDCMQINLLRNFLIQKSPGVCRKWTNVKQQDKSLARVFVPTEFDCTLSTNVESAKATVRQAIVLNFDVSLFCAAA